MFDFQEIAKSLEECSKQKRLSYAAFFKTPFKEEIEKIAQVIRSTNARQIIWHINHCTLEMPKCACGKDVKWHADQHQYRQYCSKSCSARYTTISKKVRNLQELGVEWHSQTAAWREQVKQTSLEKFGQEHYAKTKEFATRVSNTNLEKYQVAHVMHVPEFRQKQQATVESKYGVSNPAKSKEVQSKTRSTNLKLRGVGNPLQDPQIRDQIAQTNESRYGSKNPQSNSDIRKKSTLTKRIQQFGETTTGKLYNAEWLRYEQQTRSVHEIAKELGISSSQLCKIFHAHGVDIARHSSSELERRLALYFQTLGVKIIKNSREVISPKELDLWFPEHGLAVEVNGVYFHSEKFGKTRDYHLEKTKQCESKNITLLQFWDWEINNKWEQVIAMIENHVGLVKEADPHCTVKKVSNRKKSQFLKQHHIHGDSESDFNLGLYSPSGDLVSIGAFVKRSPNHVELSRVCTVPGINSVSCIKKILNSVSSSTITSTANRMHGQSALYKQLGFDLLETTPPSFFLIDSTGRGQTGTGVSFRVWDCGTQKFTLTIKQENKKDE